MENDRNRDEAEEVAPEAGSGQLRERLKQVGHYVLLGFAPVVSIVALAVALLASGNHAAKQQQDETAARMEALNASLQATRTELDNLKFAVTRDKAVRGDEHRKTEEFDAKVVQHVTRLQVKLKVSPTLEEQLREPVSAPAAAIPLPPAAVQPVVEAPAPIATPGKGSAPAASTPAPVTQDKKPGTLTMSTESAKKNPQVKALKNAIEQYNRK